MTNLSGPSRDSRRAAEDRLRGVLYELRRRFFERLCIRFGLKVDGSWLANELGLRTDRDILEQIIERNRNLEPPSGNWLSRLRYRLFGRP